MSGHQGLGRLLHRNHLHSAVDCHTQPPPTTGDVTEQCHAAVRLLCELLLWIDRGVAEAILAPLLHYLLEVHPQRKWAHRVVGEPPHASVGWPRSQPQPTPVLGWWWRRKRWRISKR